MTGFRVHPGGAQALYGITPDLTTLAKVIGGGLPVGAYGGRREVMELVAPAGPVYQAGTLSGNPLAMAAGAATLMALQEDGAWNAIADATAGWCAALEGGARDAGVELRVQRVGTMFTPFFTSEPVTNWSTARSADTARYAKFFHAMLDHGVYLPPSQFEAGFLSTAHSAQVMARAAAAAGGAFRAVAHLAGPVV